ncbi:hypothetical protein GCM10009626_19710 [Brachybacterium sacelli]
MEREELDREVLGLSDELRSRSRRRACESAAEVEREELDREVLGLSDAWDRPAAVVGTLIR